MNHKIIILGNQIQGLIAASLLAKRGMAVQLVQLENESRDYAPFADGYKTGPVTHIPFGVPESLIQELHLDNHGIEALPTTLDNPFLELPFYDGLKQLLRAFQSLENNRPAYKEKAWRDAWGTFELGRILAEHDASLQSLFAKSTTLSLIQMFDALEIDDGKKAQMIALSIMGSRTDPNAPGSAAAILPAMAVYEETGAFAIGSLHPLLRTLKQTAMTYGVEFTEDATVQSIHQENGAIANITMTNGTVLSADYFVLDADPVAFFDQYGEGFSMPPAFKNRVTKAQNLRESTHVQLVLSQIPSNLSTGTIIATSPAYIGDARTDFKRDGGSQLPMLSIQNITSVNENFAPEGHIILDVLAHYFDPSLMEDEDAHEAVIATTIQALDEIYPNLSDSIIHSAIRPMNSQAGRANFTGSMALLQLFKIFFGHHAMGYDMPFQNLLIAGYGNEACAHFHVNNGGVRVANLLHSLSNNGT